jgi:hypothetical protein
MSCLFIGFSNRLINIETSNSYAGVYCRNIPFWGDGQISPIWRYAENSARGRTHCLYVFTNAVGKILGAIVLRNDLPNLAVAFYGIEIKLPDRLYSLGGECVIICALIMKVLIEAFHFDLKCDSIHSVGIIHVDFARCIAIAGPGIPNLLYNILLKETFMRVVVWPPPEDTGITVLTSPEYWLSFPKRSIAVTEK